MVTIPQLRDFPSVDFSGLDLRSIKLPEVKFPEVKFPEVKLPDVKMPEMKLPEVKMVDVKVPEIDVDRVIGVARDTAYVGIGLTVLAIQQAQVRRREAQRAIGDLADRLR